MHLNVSVKSSRPTPVCTRYTYAEVKENHGVYRMIRSDGTYSDGVLLSTYAGVLYVFDGMGSIHEAVEHTWGPHTFHKFDADVNFNIEVRGVLA